MMCGTGIFSFSAGYRLAKAGHPAVRVVYGGYAAWQGLYPELIHRLKEQKPPGQENKFGQGGWDMSSCQNISYSTNGINLYFTRCMYSLYTGVRMRNRSSRIAR